ncbi:ABC transporter ATP-binding protein [Streptomyces sp. NPDC058953]|uniref:ABC transporter ATP-binding protein n=1 Tax=unclassified Streptomyces TaxID=2593676 RepID=UPI0036AD53DA
MKRSTGRAGSFDGDTAVRTADGAAPAARPAPLLEVGGLSVVFDTARGRVPAVRDVSFTLAPGEIFGLVGESGSGKSTVLSAIMRLLPSIAVTEADALRFRGTDLLGLDTRRLRAVRGTGIGLVPQRPMTSLSPVTPLRKQLRWFLGDRGPDEITELLDQVGLRAVAERLDGYPFEFSGGQLQRLLIMLAALARRPALLLADEPTTTLDATVQAQVLRLLLDLRDRLGVGIVFVSHDLGVIAQVCDRAGVMYAGRLVESAPVTELFDRPRHPYTQALLGALPSRYTRGQRIKVVEGSAAGANRLPGCAFAPRCPRADAVCRELLPEPRTVAGSLVRCHHAEEVAG